MKKNILSNITIVILFVGLLYLFIQIKKQEQAIQVYTNLLDRIYNDNPGYVMGVLVESDEYCDYISIK